MDDRRRHDDRDRHELDEGVRILGQEEAEAAQREGSVAPRRDAGELRFGDRPPEPDGPRPALRFPRPEPQHDDTSLPHWTEPATGQVPAAVAGDQPDEDDLEAWSTFATGTPRWRDQPSDWEAEDFTDPARLGDETTQLGALDPRRRRHDDLFGPDEPEHEPEPPRRVVTSVSSRNGAPPAPEKPMGRNVPLALATGLAFAAAALFLMAQGPGPMVVLVAAVITIAAAELFSMLQRGGHQPATLLGLVASASLVGAAYWRGEGAFPVVLALTLVFSMLWYLLGVSNAPSTVNAALTTFAVVYVGGLGAFAALLLRWPNDDGIGLLLGALLATVGYDTGGFFVGRRVGARPLAPSISPNKTYEGLVGGIVVSFVISVVVVSQIGPWDLTSAALLGAVVAVAAPLGDLVESMLKRDLGVKDSGSILPGHGGLLDRFDGLLFALPATYFLASVLDLGL